MVRVKHRNISLDLKARAKYNRIFLTESNQLSSRTMINFIFLAIFFLITIPGDVTGLEPFSCNQPFGTMADKGFSVVRKVSR